MYNEGLEPNVKKKSPMTLLRKETKKNIQQGK